MQSNTNNPRTPGQPALKLHVTTHVCGRRELPTLQEFLACWASSREPPHVVLTFGGQTAIDLAKDLAYADVPIAGLTAAAIETTEDRERFRPTPSM